MFVIELGEPNVHICPRRTHRYSALSSDISAKPPPQRYWFSARGFGKVLAMRNAIRAAPRHAAGRCGASRQRSRGCFTKYGSRRNRVLEGIIRKVCDRQCGRGLRTLLRMS